MKIIEYKMILNEDQRSILVKDFAYLYQKANFTKPTSVVELMRNKYKLHQMAVEYSFALFFNSAMRLIGVVRLSQGTVDATLVQPREVYIAALNIGATNVIMVHNHPSGNILPSKADRTTTKLIVDTGKMIGIPLLDHIIIGSLENDFFSFRQEDLI